MPRLPAKQLVTAAPVSIGTANTEGSGNAVARSDHVHSHGNQAGGALHSAATSSVAGFLPATDKARIDVTQLRIRYQVSFVGRGNVNIALTTPPTVDGPTWGNGSFNGVLLTAQTNPAENGLWRCDITAGGVASWVRSGFNMATANWEAPTAAVYEAGFLANVTSVNSTRKGAVYWCSMAPGGTIGTTAISADALIPVSQANQYGVVKLASTTPADVGTAAVGTSENAAKEDHAHAHGAQTDPTHHAIAVPNGDAGFMSGAQALKLLYVPYLAGSDVSTVGVTNSPGTSATHCAPFDHVHAHGDHNTPSMHAVATAVANGFMPAADKSKLDGMGPYTLSPAALGAAAQGASALFARGDHVHPHGDQGGGSLHALVTQSVAGFMDPVDKTRLDFFSEDAVVQNGSVGWVRPAIRMPISGTPTAMTNNTVFCIYMGYTLKAMTITVVRWYMPTAGVGTDNGCQVGIGYSVAAPNLAGLATVTPKALSAVSSPLATGNKTNSTLFNLAVPAGTHLWGLVKSALATTQMSSYPIVGDVTGSVQSKGSAGTLVVDTNIVCTAYAASAPDLTLQAA